MSTAVFLDTVGLLALWDRSDQWHDRADAAWLRLQTESDLVMTTSFVLLECGNAAARRPYRQAVDRLRTQLDLAGLLVTPQAEDWELAWQAYRCGDSDSAGIVDQVSFTVMRRLKLTRAFTNDRHFASAGFQTLF